MEHHFKYLGGDWGLKAVLTIHLQTAQNPMHPLHLVEGGSPGAERNAPDTGIISLKRAIFAAKKPSSVGARGTKEDTLCSLQMPCPAGQQLLNILQEKTSITGRPIAVAFSAAEEATMKAELHRV